MSKLVPIADVQEELHISRSQVYRYIDSGWLIRANIGTRAYITRASIDALVSKAIQESA